MSSIEKILAPLLYLIRNHKKTVLIIILSALTFPIFLFPYDDISDKVIEQVAKLSNNKVFMQFDSMGIALLPPSVEMDNVSVEIANLPTLTASRLNLAPSIASYLAFTHGFTATAKDLIDGQMALTLKAGRKAGDKARKQILDFEFEDFDIQKVTKLLGKGNDFDITGKGSVDLYTIVDPTFSDQPEANIQFLAKEFEVRSVSTPIGPLVLNIKGSSLTAKVKLAESDLDVTEVIIGKPGEGLSGKMRGRMGLRFEQRGQQVVPLPTNYDFTIDLNLDRQNDSKLGLLFGAIGADKYKTVTGTGVRYAFRLRGNNLQSPPTVGPAAVGL